MSIIVMNKVAEAIRVREAYLFPSLETPEENFFSLNYEWWILPFVVNEHSESEKLIPWSEVGPALNLWLLKEPRSWLKFKSEGNL